MREMKESGIPWIGKIAKDVSIYTLKYGTYMKGRIGWQGLKSSDFINEGPFCVTSTDFRNGRINWDTCYHVSEKRYDMDPYIQIQKGDLLISKDGTIGKLALVDNLPDKACLNSHLLIIRPLNHNLNVKYLYYVLDSPIFTKYYSIVGSGSTMQSLSQEKLGNFKLPMWEINQQQAITNYLDAKCADIDTLQQDLQSEIETLQAYKKSLITRAVTQGLDSHVEMKNSGVKWIGKIPKKWKVERLKYLYDKKFGDAVRVGPFGNTLKTQDFCDSGPWIYSQRTVLDNNFTDNTLHVTKQKANQLASFRVQPHDILITTRGTIGKIAIVPENAPEGILHPCLIRFRVHGINQFFLRYIFNETDITMEQIISKSLGTTIPVIYSYNLKNILLPIPSLNEQNSIVKYLDSKCSEIDSIIASKQKQSEILSDYKKSLIYEVVTGKKEVPVHE